MTDEQKPREIKTVGKVYDMDKGEGPMVAALMLDEGYKPEEILQMRRSYGSECTCGVHLPGHDPHCPTHKD